MAEKTLIPANDRPTPAEYQARRIEQALNRVTWDIEDAIADLHDVIIGVPAVDWIPALLHEADGIILDGNDPGPWLMQQLKQRVK